MTYLFFLRYKPIFSIFIAVFFVGNEISAIAEDIYIPDASLPIAWNACVANEKRFGAKHKLANAMCDCIKERGLYTNSYRLARQNCTSAWLFSCTNKKMHENGLNALIAWADCYDELSDKDAPVIPHHMTTDLNAIESMDNPNISANAKWKICIEEEMKLNVDLKIAQPFCICVRDKIWLKQTSYKESRQKCAAEYNGE